MSGITRRRFIGIAGGGIAVFVAGGTPASGKASRAWQFTDDRGVTVSLRTSPTRSVAYDAAASALGNLGLKPAGIFASLPLDKDPQLRGLDLRKVAKVGESYAQLDLETLAAVRPDLIVTGLNPLLSRPVLGFPDEETRALAEQIAPIVAIDTTKDVTAVIARFEKLGAALGADLKAPAAVAARRRFRKASARVRSATGANPGLTALAVIPCKGYATFVARPDRFPTLRLYKKLGLQMVDAGGRPGDINKAYDSYHFRKANFDLTDDHLADLVMYDTRPGAMSVQELTSMPAWRTLPAVSAGQLLSWRVHDAFSYNVLARDLERLARAVERAKVVATR